MMKLNSASEGRMGSHSHLVPDPHGVWRSVPTDNWANTRSFLRRLWDIPMWAYRGYNEKNAGDLAASVAYHALVALVPIFLLLVTVAGLFLQSDAVLQQARESIDIVFPSGGSVAEAFIDALNARNNSGLFGLFSLLGFAWAGTGFVSSLGRSMNRIYGVRNASYVNEKQRGFIVILIFAIFFLISSSSSIVTTFFVNQELPEGLRRWWLSTGQNQVFGYVIAVFSALILFLVVYRIVPNAGQKLWDVWPGTITAAILFSVTTQAFPIYIRMLGGANRYGVLLGLVSLIVASVYILAHIMLFGAYINATWQGKKRQRQRAEAMRKQTQLARKNGHGPAVRQTGQRG